MDPNQYYSQGYYNVPPQLPSAEQTAESQEQWAKYFANMQMTPTYSYADYYNYYCQQMQSQVQTLIPQMQPPLPKTPPPPHLPPPPPPPPDYTESPQIPSLLSISIDNRNISFPPPPPPNRHARTLSESSSPTKPKKREKTGAKTWTLEQAKKALEAEKDCNKKSRNWLKITFPDEELSPEIVQALDPDIETVYFQHASAKRTSHIMLTESANADEVIAELSSTRFGGGFLKVEYRKPRQDETNEGPEDIDPLVLYLTNLSPETTKEDIAKLFPKQIDIHLSCAKKMKPTWFAFVIFDTVEDAVKAILASHAVELHNKPLSVRFRRLNGTVGLPGEIKHNEPIKVNKEEIAKPPETASCDNITNSNEEHSQENDKKETTDVSNDLDEVSVNLDLVKNEPIDLDEYNGVNEKTTELYPNSLNDFNIKEEALEQAEGELGCPKPLQYPVKTEKELGCPKPIALKMEEKEDEDIVTQELLTDSNYPEPRLETVKLEYEGIETISCLQESNANNSSASCPVPFILQVPKEEVITPSVPYIMPMPTPRLEPVVKNEPSFSEENNTNVIPNECPRPLLEKAIKLEPEDSNLTRLQGQTCPIPIILQVPKEEIEQEPPSLHKDFSKTCLEKVKLEPEDIETNPNFEESNSNVALEPCFNTHEVNPQDPSYLTMENSVLNSTDASRLTLEEGLLSFSSQDSGDIGSNLQSSSLQDNNINIPSEFCPRPIILKAPLTLNPKPFKETPISEPSSFKNHVLTPSAQCPRPLIMTDLIKTEPEEPRGDPQCPKPMLEAIIKTEEQCSGEELNTVLGCPKPIPVKEECPETLEDTTETENAQINFNPPQIKLEPQEEVIEEESTNYSASYDPRCPKPRVELKNELPDTEEALHVAIKTEPEENEEQVAKRPRLADEGLMDDDAVDKEFEELLARQRKSRNIQAVCQ